MLSRKCLVVTCAATVTCLGLLAPSSSAEPPGFPDLSKFTEVDAAQFSRPFSYAERWANVYSFFRTLDGINCTIGPGSWCSGNIPGLPQDRGSACKSVDQEANDQQFTFTAHDSRCEPTKDKVLNPGQKLTDSLTGTKCVVGENRLTACVSTQGKHGFVLQPSGSWAF
ncbi:hypothetical protein [Mycobacterium sp. DL440]|uniref:hypothetical protein n=1 Tax=Mycobacterium sp. DL440 TaxID=2675523 RepID=UPI0014214783|nr:hypothetical protein [Mycobacterium sp. DL440]